MSKGLVDLDLEKIKRAHITIFPDKKKEDGSLYTETEFEEEFNNIEKALKDGESFKNAYCEMLDTYNKDIIAQNNLIAELRKKEEALEIFKKAFNSSSIYTNKLQDSLECGWITQEEYDLIVEILK